MALSPLSPLPPTASLRKDHNIIVRITEAKNLPPDCMDMYAVIRVDNDVANQFKTRTIWRSRTPFWDEESDFNLGKTFNDVYIEVYNRSKFSNTLVGYLKLPKMSLELDNRSHEDWYPLRAAKKDDSDDNAEQKDDAERKPHDFKPHAFNAPVSCDHCGNMIWGSKRIGSKCSFCGLNCHKEDCEAGASKLSCGSVGVVRVRYKYTDEYILPLPTYAKLMEFFMSKTLDVIVAYGMSTDEREDAAKTLVRISVYTDHAVDFLSRLLAVEVANCADPNTIFRANSIASKAVDYYMKLIGMPYLTNVLKPIMDEIISANRSCEVDSTRLEKGEEIEANRAVLQAYMDWVFKKITETVTKCPAPLRHIFHNLSQEVIAKWPENEQVRFTCVSGFIFLRFFNAAILGPKLFGLSVEHPNQRVSRTLTLLSKSMQQLANLVRFDGKKEPYMTPFNNFIISKSDSMKIFIKKLSSLPEEAIEKKSSPSQQRRSTAVDIIPWNKSKKNEKAAKKDKDEVNVVTQEKIDIEIELASMHRAFCRAEDKMKAVNEANPNPEVSKLFSVLAEMGYVYAARAKEVEAERESVLSSLMREDEVSLNDFLAGPTSPTTEIKQEKVYAGYISGVSPRDIHASSVLNNVNVNLGGTVGSVTVEEAFDMVDTAHTGVITRFDFDSILGTFGLSASAEVVLRAFAHTSLDQKSQTMPRTDYLAVMSELVPVLTPTATKSKDPAKDAALLKANPQVAKALRASVAIQANSLQRTGSMTGSSGASTPTPSTPVGNGPSTPSGRPSTPSTPDLVNTSSNDLNLAVRTVMEYLHKEGLTDDASGAISQSLLLQISSMGSNRLDPEMQQTLTKLAGSSDSKVTLGTFVSKAIVTPST